MRVRFVLVAAGFMVLAVASPAYAGGPTDITVTPPLAAPVEVSRDRQPDLFDTLNQVSYQAGLEMGRRDSAAPPSAVAPVVPGPRYRVQVAYHQRPAYEYEWYPMSSDGPRVYVPRQQPGDYGMPGEPGWYASTESMVFALRQLEALAAPAPPSAAGASSPEVGGPAMDAPTPLPVPSRWSALIPVAVVVAVLAGLALLSRPLFRRRLLRRSMLSRTLLRRSLLKRSGAPASTDR